MTRYGSSQPQLRPRNGIILVVGIVARISGCANQKELSLEDQIDHAKQVVAEMYDGPVEFRVVATKGKGERLDRPELADIQQMLRAGELDLLIVEDIGRLIRGAEAVRLCGIAVDHGTRVLAPNDCIDTAQESWEEDVISASRDHVGHNAHTSKRLKHKLMNRFEKFGGATALVPPGYEKPEGTKTYDDWRKIHDWTPIIQEGLRRLRASLNCSAVADWFNEVGMTLGNYGRRKAWNGAKVRIFYHNPILKGMPWRGSRETVKHNETGRRISVKSPKGPVFRACPHLAHVDPILFDEVNALLIAKNANRGRVPVNGTDPLWRVPRKRTRFPGQYARCWFCGRHFVWGGNGIADNLQCSGSRDWHCWNSIGFNGELAAKRLVSVIADALFSVQGLEAQFATMVRAVTLNGADDMARNLRLLESSEQSLARDKENWAAAIAQYGPRPMFHEKLLEIEAREQALKRDRYNLDKLKGRKLLLPESIEDLRQQLEVKFQRLTIASPEFGDLMRELVPEYHVYLVRLLDGGHLLPRARIKLDLAGSIPDAVHVPGLNDLFSREVTLDLFLKEPQRERIRCEAVRLEAQGLTQRQIAAQLDDEKPKLPVVQEALALDRRMKELGLDSPYVMVSEPPEDYTKLRRHKNPRYGFTPLDGYERPSL